MEQEFVQWKVGTNLEWLTREEIKMISFEVLSATIAAGSLIHQMRQDQMIIHLDKLLY